jgi:DNA-binding MarR family transcriptional regulator
MSARLERELMLLARRHVLVQRQHSELLERSAYVVLTRLETEGPMSIRQLTEAFGLDTSTVNRQTAALVRCDLVERIPDDTGRLARKLRITPLGRQRLQADREYYLGRIDLLLAGWTQEELDQLTAALTRFNRTVEQFEDRHWPRPDLDTPRK